MWRGVFPGVETPGYFQAVPLGQGSRRRRNLERARIQAGDGDLVTSVPQGHLTIARRFNAGSRSQNNHQFFPALKRRAIFEMSRWDKTSSDEEIKSVPEYQQGVEI
jgi:hypothetical protein